MISSRLIKSNNAAAGCVDIVDAYDPFDGNGVALYQLNGNATDISGNYDGTATNVTYGTGVFGQAGVFNGSSSIIDLPNNSFNFTTVSVSFWLKLNSITGEDYVLDVYDQASNSARGYAISTDASNKIKFRAWDNSNFAEVFSSSTLSINTWYYIAMVATQTSASIYINGSLDNSGSLNGFSFYAQQSTSIGAFRGTVGGGSVAFLDGSLDQLRIFNTALDPLEVEALYTEELCICGGTVDTLDILDDSSCIALYPLDGNANDLSGNYSGTPTNVSYGVGEFDLAGVFNGSSSRILSNVGMGVDHSVSLWIKFNSISSAQKEFLDWSDTSTGRTLRLNTYNSNQIRFSTDVDQFYYNGVTTGVWYHLVYSGDGKCFVNSSLVATLAEDTSTTGDYFYLGSNHDLNRFSDCSIDQVRIFNKALNSTEVTTLYNETACTPAACTSGTTNTLDILGDGSCIATYTLDGSPLDLSGNYNGIQTDVTYPQGEFDLAGSFNGSTSKISHDLKWQTNSSFSFSVWVKPTTTPTSGLKAILMNVNANADQTGAIFYTEGNQIAFIGTTSNGSWTDLGLYLFGPSPTGGVWTNYVIVKDGSTLRAYTNGSLTKSAACSAGAFATSSLQEIGGNAGNPNFAANFWNGQIDQVRFFNKALSAGEVTTLYNETPCN